MLAEAPAALDGLRITPAEVTEALALVETARAAMATPLGRVGGEALRIAVDGEAVVDVPVAALAARYEGALPAALGEVVAAAG